MLRIGKCWLCVKGSEWRGECVRTCVSVSVGALFVLGVEPRKAITRLIKTSMKTSFTCLSTWNPLKQEYIGFKMAVNTNL